MSSEEDGLAEIFRRSAELQEFMGNDFNTMSAEKLIAYIKEMILGATDELHEALAETHWKSWSSAPPGFRDRDKFVGELIDAQHFLVNLFLAARVTPDEMLSRYGGKSAINRERQLTGYTGTDKCDSPRCRRALDEPSILPGTIITWSTGERFCSGRCEADARAMHLDIIRTQD